jgi:hypothetical protein
MADVFESPAFSDKPDTHLFVFTHLRAQNRRALLLEML